MTINEPDPPPVKVPVPLKGRRRIQPPMVEKNSEKNIKWQIQVFRPVFLRNEHLKFSYAGSHHVSYGRIAQNRFFFLGNK